MTREYFRVKAPKSKAEKITDLETKLNQVEAAIKDHSERPADLESYDQKIANEMLRGLMKLRDDYQLQMNKLKGHE